MPSVTSIDTPAYLLLNKQDWPEINFAEGHAPLPHPFSSIADFIQQRFADYGPFAAATAEEGKAASNLRGAMQFGGLIVRAGNGKPEAILGYNYFPRDDGEGGTQRCCNIGFVMVDESLRGQGEFLTLMKRLVEEVAPRSVSHITLHVDLGNRKAVRLYERLEGDGLLRRTGDWANTLVVEGKEKLFPGRSFEGSVCDWLRAFKMPPPVAQPIRAHGVSHETRRALLELH